MEIIQCDSCRTIIKNPLEKGVLNMEYYNKNTFSIPEAPMYNTLKLDLCIYCTDKLLDVLMNFKKE